MNDLGSKNLAPKAEVTGSNLVGYANDFNWLYDSSQDGGLGYVRIILVVLVPTISELRTAHLTKIDNWDSTAFAGKL